jgi:hypothetical protein
MGWFVPQTLRFILESVQKAFQIVSYKARSHGDIHQERSVVHEERSVVHVNMLCDWCGCAYDVCFRFVALETVIHWNVIA